MSHLLDRMVRDYAQDHMAQGRRQAEREANAVAAYSSRPAVQKLDRLAQLQRQMHMREVAQ
jgi:hypothetical protein